MAVLTARHWGLLPHVIWRFPFRYYKELRDAYIASLKSRPDNEPTFDFDADAFEGGPT